MDLYGLTGGIATGKSTVSAMFRRAGVPVIDADELAREVVAPGQPALSEIAAHFPGSIRADGSLDRGALGAQIFSDSRRRSQLEGITHPRIRALAREKAAALEAAGVKRAIYDAPLLIENQLHRGLLGVILVVCPPEVQLARLKARNGLSDEQARQRIGSQMPLDEKRPFATWIIDNGGPLSRTQEQVDRVLEQWRSQATQGDPTA